MNRLTCVITIILSITPLFQGCASSSPRDYNPNTQLEEVLPMDKTGYGYNINCNERDDLGNSVIDCEQLEQKMERLYLEFPNNTRIMMVNAVLQFELGNMSNSQLILDQLLSKPGANPEAAILRSRIAMSEGNMNLARVMIDRQLRLVPDYAELYEARAASYFLEGRYDKALAELASADRLGTAPWRISYHNGLIYEALENWTMACQNFFSVLGHSMEHRPSTAKLLLLQEHAECHGYLVPQ